MQKKPKSKELKKGEHKKEKAHWRLDASDSHTEFEPTRIVSLQLGTSLSFHLRTRIAMMGKNREKGGRKNAKKTGKTEQKTGTGKAAGKKHTKKRPASIKKRYCHGKILSRKDIVTERYCHRDCYN